MSYLAFKEKMNTFKTDEFERAKLFNKLQVGFVAGFWILFTAALLYYDYDRKQLEKAAFKVPDIPELSTISNVPQNASIENVEVLSRP